MNKTSKTIKTFGITGLAFFVIMSAGCGAKDKAADAVKTAPTEIASVVKPTIAMVKPGTPAETVKRRQSVYKDMGAQMKPLAGMARGKTDIDASVVVQNAVNVKALGQQLPALFAVDTRGTSVETEADPKIWDNISDFSAKMDSMISAAAALEAAGRTGEADAIKKAIGGLGRTCKSCHDDYRTKK